MIEIPRAALVADEIAKEADFFSFGTNDLTQMTFGYSRDDVGKFLPTYLAQGILQNDPFEVLDQRGFGQLINIATERGRSARPSLKSLPDIAWGKRSRVLLDVGCGIPAISSVMGTKRLTFPGDVFDVVHCASCRVPWHVEGGKLLLKLNRVLRPGGYFVWSATSVYRKNPEDSGIWKARTVFI